MVPSPNPLTASVQGLAAAGSATAAASQSIAAGASATFNFTFVESGTGAGALSFSAGATGVDVGTGLQVIGTPVQSNMATVLEPAALAVESISLPPRVSRGQSFTVDVSVKNTGGTTANAVLPSPNPPTVAVTGAAAATLTTAPAAMSVAPGASARFSYVFRESGTGAGTLRFATGASGTNAGTGSTVSAASLTSTPLTVETPPALTARVFAPAAVARGGAFAVSMTVTNSGGATALNVLPSPTPLTATATGGAAATTASAPAAVSIVGGGSQTFTWTYLESGVSAGTLSFTGVARGVDANSAATVAAASASSPVMQVVAPAKLEVVSLTAPTTITRGPTPCCRLRARPPPWLKGEPPPRAPRPPPPRPSPREPRPPSAGRSWSAA